MKEIVFPTFHAAAIFSSTFLTPSFLSKELSEGYRGYYLNMKYTVSALGISCCISLLSPFSFFSPAFVLQYITALLISGHFCCQDTEEQKEFKQSICIIELLTTCPHTYMRWVAGGKALCVLGWFK